MALTVYETDINWTPTDASVNAIAGGDYIGWRLGENRKAGTAIWTFGRIDPTPSLEEDELVPDESYTFSLVGDLTKYGYVRTVFPNAPIEKVEAAFNQYVNFLFTGTAP